MHIRFFTILVLSAILMACTSENGKSLKEADSVIEEYPDSAMSILMSIDRHSLNNRDLPYYALLYTQAQVKTYISLDSDSLISIAFAKYGENTRGDLGIRSNFYTGEVFFNQKKYHEAMRYYLKAYEESKRLNNDYWHAKAAERMTDLFFHFYHYDEAEKFAKEAADYFNKSNRVVNHRYLLALLSIIYLNNNKVDLSYSILDSLYNLSVNEDRVDSTFVEYIEQPLLESAVKLNKREFVDINPNEFFREDMSEGDKIDAVMFLNSISGSDNNQKIKVLLNEISPLATDNDDHTHILYAKYENAKALNDLALAISYVDSLLDYQVLMTEKIIKESITGVQRDFYSDLSIQQKKKSSFLTYIIIVSVATFI
ncbi:MAG: hypothetical protein K2K25_06125, partial [Muribaculaceae bacterium]|nr:hypothetical protein [Muribaculaceae bacterium]